MTKYSHHEVMTTAMVSELKAKLSGYLAEVRQGNTITVCDRQTPIARIVPLDAAPGGLEVREATDPAGLPKRRPVRLRKRVDAAAILREDRDHR